MRIPLFAFLHKDRHAGWRLVWYGFAFREQCQWWRWAVPEGAALCNLTRCRCCKAIRKRGAHTHSGFMSGHKALERRLP